MVIALLVVVVLTVAGFALLSRTKHQTEPPNAVQAPAADPFAHLPPETAPVPRGGARAATPNADPFANLPPQESLAAEAVPAPDLQGLAPEVAWAEALRLNSESEAELLEAGKLRDLGGSEGAQSAGLRGKHLLERACEHALAVENSGSPMLAEKARQQREVWQKKLAALHKMFRD